MPAPRHSAHTIRVDLPTQRRYLLQSAVPVFVLYCFWVARTPPEMFSIDSPFWYPARMAVFILWLAIIYFHTKPDLRYNQKAFIAGVIFGGSWLAALLAYRCLVYLDSRPQVSAMLLPFVATAIFYGILAGFWACQSSTFWRAALSSFLFLLVQVLVDLVLHAPFYYHAN